jgi:predicted metal-dependent hydrolase
LYIASKIGWIKRQQKLLREKPRQSPRKYVTGETHYFLGRSYRLKLISGHEKYGVTIKSKSTIEMMAPPDATIEMKSELMKAFYRKELKLLLTEMIFRWSQKMEVNPSLWQVKIMKTKWGSCNTEKETLLFNLELAKKPKSCIEYIVVHELVHLKERLHNERFTNHMDNYMPKWREHKSDLNKLPVSHAEWNY